MKRANDAYRGRARNAWHATMFLAIGLVFALQSPSGATGPASPQQQQLTTPASACLYAFEWIHSVRFPLQADPHAAYSYVVPTLPADGQPVGFLIDADFPYAAWFSWTTYGEHARAFSLASDHDIVPDPGSVNPFVTFNPVFAPVRHYRLLLLPPGASVAPSLADIPNRLTMPTDVSTFAIAYRVYQAFPGYDLGGSGGPTNTPFPAVYAIDYETGEPLDCAGYNALPPTIGRPPTDTPEVYNLYGTTAADIAPGREHRALAEAERILRVPELAALQSKVGWQFAPQIDPTLVTFTRPPLVAGADVSSIPPPDNCAGYLGASVDPRRVALIRIPHVAAIFETAALAPDTLYPDSEAAYTSLTMYGAAVNTYEPGEAESTSLANAEFQPDATGGSTIVVWPRNLPTGERESLFDYARRNGWALIRGGKAGPFTTANMFLRLKGASPDYYGAYTPIPDVRTGVPCYFDNAPRGTPWTAIESAPDPMSYVASFQNIGDAAPQGVHCASVAEVLDGSCLIRLEAHIEESGGTYFSSGGVSPPIP